ncbi:hypothetical protein M0812_24861 [Anaeramoeba flamelloides]|uniref:Myb-like domain-containing protein n=1 Tax=Anaeramoeba flamelloides TaxID=1746091 RepID=A0AAV7YIC1_9EUKA|nr:hypothetical protein M0812_24861 [Anaeramoeba flamelloides]
MSKRNLASKQNSDQIQRNLFVNTKNNNNHNFQEYPPLYPKKFSNQLIFHLQLNNKKDYLNLFPQQNSLHLKTDQEYEDEDEDEGKEEDEGKGEESLMDLEIKTENEKGNETKKNENKKIKKQQKKQAEENQIAKVTTLNTNTLTKEERISCYKNFILKTKICRSEHGIFGVHLNSKDYRINYQFNTKNKFQQKQQTQTKLDLQTNPHTTQAKTRGKQNQDDKKALLRSLPRGWNKWTLTKRRTWLAFGTNNNLFYLHFNHPGEELKVGKWTQEEEEVFLKRCKKFGVNRGWGLFSQTIQGRIGRDCLDHFKLRLKNDINFSEEYKDKYQKHKANTKRRKTKSKIATNRIGERKRKTVDPNSRNGVTIDPPKTTNKDLRSIKRKRKSTRLRIKQIPKSQGITKKKKRDKLALQTLPKQLKPMPRNLVPIVFTENEIMTRKTLLNQKFQEFGDLILENIDPLKQNTILKQLLKEEEGQGQGQGKWQWPWQEEEEIMKNFELNQDYDDEFSFTDEEEEEFEVKQEEEIKKNEREEKLNQMVIEKTENEKLLKTKKLTNSRISSNTILNQDRENDIQNLQTKKSKLQNIIYQNVESNSNVPKNRNNNSNKNLNDQKSKTLDEKNIDPNQKNQEEEEQYLNPLPGLIDSITGVEIKVPCLSSTGYVLDQTTWKKELKKKPSNICPFTKTIIQPQSLILLTTKNIGQYLSKILNLDFNKLRLITKKHYLKKKKKSKKKKLKKLRKKEKKERKKRREKETEGKKRRGKEKEGKKRRRKEKEGKKKEKKKTKSKKWAKLEKKNKIRHKKN